MQRSLEVAAGRCCSAAAAAARGGSGPPASRLAKVLDNMEIGHNVLHGQWDWMRDPKIHSSTWEWDHVSPPEQWQRAHNDTHHNYTNILGKDNDLGYGIMRVDEAQEWQPRYLVQPLWNLVTACIFEYGIAMYDLDLGETSGQAAACRRSRRPRSSDALRRARKRCPRTTSPPGAVRPRLALHPRRQR